MIWNFRRWRRRKDGFPRCRLSRLRRFLVFSPSAPVILAGSLVIGELMRTGGYGSLTVSENSLMAGMAATLYEALCKEVPAIGWMPRVSC